jgi:gamma-glutamyltranspeptidase/glutathione hydrolase
MSPSPSLSLSLSRLLRLSVCTTLCLVLLVFHVPSVLPSPLDSYDRYIHAHKYERSAEAHGGKRGAVASESAICSRHGTDIILMGGNAADAVSSPYIVLCYSCGLLRLVEFLQSGRLLIPVDGRDDALCWGRW